MDGWFFHLVLHHSKYGMDFIMYFGHHVTPLTSHIRGHLLQLILPHMVDHTFMAFPIPLQTLWTPWTIIVPFMFPISSLKNMHYLLYMTFKPILTYIRGYDPKTHVHRDVRKRTNSFGVFLDVDPSHLSLGLPYALDCLDLTFHYPIEALYKEPFGYIERRRN